MKLARSSVTMSRIRENGATWLALLILGLLPVACGSASTAPPATARETPRASETPAPMRTATPAAPPTKVDPPPASYAELAPTYTALQTATLAYGSEVSALVVAKDAAALFARFDGAMRAEVPLSGLERILDQLAARAPIGERVDARVLFSGGRTFYAAAHEWGRRKLGVYAALDRDGTITGLELPPLQAEPLDPAADEVSAVPFRLPFDGLWHVGWGGPDELHNYHVTVPFQRYAYDFLIWKDGGTCRAPCAANTDYYVFGQPILAPADGEVVVAVGDQPDQTPGHVLQAIDPGNYVILRVAEGQYLFIAHIQQGSLQVRAGERVQAGGMIGRVGNSGRTSEPHIHVHLQDKPRFALTGVRGLPLFFHHYLADGEPVERGMPLGSQFVQPQP